MLKTLIARILVLMTLVATLSRCGSAVTVAAPLTHSPSAEETLAYLQQRLVGWSAYSDTERVENQSVTLQGCVLTVSQKRTDAKGISRVLHRDYPLDRLHDFEWYPDLFLPGAVQAAGKDHNAVIRLRWDNDKTGRYYNVDYFRDLPAEYGERIAKALNHLKKICVAGPDPDPFK